MFIEPEMSRARPPPGGDVHRTRDEPRPPSARRADVYRTRNEPRPPSARRAMFIEPEMSRARPPPGGPCFV